MKKKKSRKSVSRSLVEKENIIPIAAALLVIFTALINPIISFTLAAAMIIIYLLYRTISQES